MKLFKGKKKSETPVQTACTHSYCGHPFTDINGYIPLKGGEQRLYATLREALPIIDSAICKIVRLMGDFTVECGDKSAQKQINRFLQNVQVNATGVGINTFLGTYLDQMLTYGTAIGEIVPDANSNNIGALYNADLDDVELKQTDNPLEILICRRWENGDVQPVPYQSLVMVTALSPDPGSVIGTSVLHSLPFVSDVLLKIINTVGVNWERVGNVRFAVTYKPSGDMTAGAYTRERAAQIATEWSKAMRDTSQVSDFVSVGDVDIKVIGADNQVLDCQVSSRIMLEQIVSKLSIPPFLLGLSWSSTERMSSQQADILTSELEYYRSLLNPVIIKICTLWLRLNGYDDICTINWSNINLQDEVELASARLANAQAKQIEEQLKSSEVNQ
ncbi:MAG TPA: serine/threonine protein phosphatase [Clostridiales bacterium]|nr:serine/threonine protein phosphatase [Clostridiales bacterium]